MNQSPVSARISGRNDFHSDSEVSIGEGIRRSGLGETILFRYNSKTQFRHDAPVAQLDRVLGYEPRGWEFDSLRAHHPFNNLARFLLRPKNHCGEICGDPKAKRKKASMD
jgi:hypothetical protein